MLTVNIHQAKTQLSRLLIEVEEHHEVVRICRNGKPIAKLVPIAAQPVDHLKQNPRLKGVEVYCDLTAPLSEDEWSEEFR